MSRRSETIPADWFETLYREKGDPWDFTTSAYEAEKYRATLAALDRPRFDRALEIGCAIGIMTAMLANRCDDMVGIDGSRAALDQATRRCAGLPNVQLREAMVPDGFPPGHFDLVVASEVLYYLTEADLARTARQCLQAQPEGGTILLCHWLGETDYPQSGAAASDAVVAAATAAGYRHDRLHDEIYRLDRLTHR